MRDREGTQPPATGAAPARDSRTQVGGQSPSGRTSGPRPARPELQGAVWSTGVRGVPPAPRGSAVRAVEQPGKARAPLPTAA